MFSVLPFLLVISGCVSQPNKAEESVSHSYQLDKKGLYLQDVSLGSVTKFAQSPWGDNVSIKVIDSYTAATNRACLKVNVTKSKGQEMHPALLCEVVKNVWEPIRFFAG